MASDGGGADRIFHHGRFHTLAPSTSRAIPTPGSVSALAAADGRIVAVGDDDDVLAFAGPDTEHVDLHGAIVVPGFIETHMHPMLWGQLLSNVHVGPTTCTDVDDIVAAIGERAAITPDGEPVRAWGFDDTLVREDRELTRFDLDRATRRHPVMVLHVSGHSAYANSMLLERSGITRETRIRRAVVCTGTPTARPRAG